MASTRFIGRTVARATRVTSSTLHGPSASPRTIDHVDARLARVPLED
jgi:hypothetical protein